jgi:hypothetical protein
MFSGEHHLQYDCFESILITLGKLLTVFMLLLWRQHIIVVDVVDYKNHVNSDHVRQTTYSVYVITVTSTYHSRRCGRLQVIVIWRRQENGWVNTGVLYLTVCLITEIYQDRSFSFHDADSSK